MTAPRTTTPPDLGTPAVEAPTLPDELPASLSEVLAMSHPGGQVLAEAHGASARVAWRSGHELIEVRDAEQRVLFELDTVTGKARVFAPTGTLSLEAPHGDIELVAGGKVRARGEVVELAGGRDGTSSLMLGDRLARLSAKGLVFAAERIESAAERILERARNAYRHVEDLHQLRAKRTRTLVEEGHVVRAGHASLEATEEVRIDGSRIDLG
ncbi:MAG: DUF3540 domain-containing protein [Deltaproteobacteria bacterium]|nr:DUF3540 domain-containing protein [Deltaproteobacteria bacterium]